MTVFQEETQQNVETSICCFLFCIDRLFAAMLGLEYKEVQ